MATRKSKATPDERSDAVAVIRPPRTGQPASRPAAQAEPAAVQPVAAPPATPDPDQPPGTLLNTAGGVIDPRSLLFDPDWYLARYPDVAASGMDPIRHFFDNGAREQRDPNPFFVTGDYLSEYSDVAASRMNPFLHYLLYGAREGRKPRADHAAAPPAERGIDS